ncbi:DUF4214 domain-containing protein [Roseovarius sp. D0-M9]|uniref:DUF4214 domain-containing protein n=1 Tax=Roseovarius sp. D0-M9 TaxID=3127117 RepID=UPI0030100E83
MPIASADLTVQQQITAIYIAYYDRAPDPAGLQFWVDKVQGGRSLTQVASDFSAAAETTAKYPFFNAPVVTSAETFIASIYTNLFGRTPDAAGQAFWSAQLSSGSTPVGEIILAILEGAQDEASGGFPDSETVTNKIDTGIDWVESATAAGIGLSANPIAVEIDGKIVVNNQAAFDSATSILDNVDGTAQSVTTAKASTDTFIAGTTDTGTTDTGGTGTGRSFALTTGADTGAAFVGTANNDIFNAAQTTAATWSVGDAIDGGAGNDTFNVTQTAAVTNPTGATVKNIETMNVVSGTTATDLNTTTFTGLTALNISAPGAVAATSAATTDVAITNATQGNGAISVNGGKDVSVTASGTTTGTINVGATTVAKGAVTISETISGAGTVNGGAITVKGGTTVNTTTTATNTNTAGQTVTQGNVTVNGTADTTAATVKQSEAVAAVTAVTGVTAATETATFTFADITNGGANGTSSLIIAGRVIFVNPGQTATAADIAVAFATGTDTGNANVSGTLFDYTAAAGTGTNVVFTSTTPNTNVANISVSRGTSGDSTVPDFPTRTISDGAAAVEAVTGVGGIAAGDVSITDANSTSTTAAGTITIATLENFGAATVNSSALTALNLAGKGTSVNAGTLGALTTAANTALAVNVNGLTTTGAVTIDSDITTLNIGSNTAASTVNSLVANGAKTVNVAGDAKLTLTGQTLGAVTDIVITNTAGASFGTALANGVQFTGGSGADSIKIAGSTKASTMGDGDDSVEMTATAFGAGGSVDAGGGTDTLKMTSANAATASATATFEANISNFEKVSLGQTLGNATDSVNLANLDDISYVVTAGTAAGGAAGATNETATVTFNSLLEGQSVTIGGKTVTAASDMTAIEVAEEFDNNSTVTVGGATYNTADNAGTASVVLTAQTVGDKVDVTASAQNTSAATFDNNDVSNETQGVAQVNAEAEVADVSVSDLLAGESTTITDTGGGSRTVTATGVTETATATFGNINTLGAGIDSSYTVAGRTVTLADNATFGFSYTHAEIAAAIADGSTTTAGGGTITVSGSLNGYTAVDNPATGEVTFTSIVQDTNVQDITITEEGPSLNVTPTITQGDNGNLTANEVAAALAGGVSGTGPAVVVDNGAFGYTGAANGSTVTFTGATAEAKADLTASSASGTQPTVTVTNQGVDAVKGVTEEADVSFEALNSGESITVAGRTVTANGDNLTEAQVEAAYLGGVNAGNAVISGTLAGWTVAQNGVVGDSILTFTSTAASTPVDDIDTTFNITGATPPTGPTITVTDGTATGPSGALTLNGLASGATVELTGANAGSTTVNLASTTGTSDVVNLKLNGASNLAAGAVNVDGVESIAIESTDSNTTANPAAPSTLALNAAAAESITLSGNHGVDFTGSTLTNLTSFDASANTAGVTVSVAGAAQGVKITGTAKADNITGGNGSDVILAGAGNDTITGGAGNDTITGGAGNDKMTGGAGDDTFNIAFGGEGTDTITDFLTGSNTLDFTGNSNVVNVRNPDAHQVVVSANTSGSEILEINSGFAVIDNGSANVGNAASLSTTDVAAYLADIDNSGDGTDQVVFQNDNSSVYIAVSDGTNGAIFRADAGGFTDTTINAGNLTLIVNLTGVSDASTITHTTLADFGWLI